ncbi:ribonuclease H1 [Mycena crocata]|nr:ribonuclease H1 [Mycena crocata]
MYEINVWTDGTCRGNGYLAIIGGAGVYSEKPLNGSQGWKWALPRDQPPTKQRAELAGVLMALYLARDRRDVLVNNPWLELTIRTDSKYAVDCYTKLIHAWARNGWHNKAGSEVANRDLLQESRALIEDLEHHGEVTFLLVPRGQNREANALANAACADQEQ